MKAMHLIWCKTKDINFVFLIYHLVLNLKSENGSAACFTVFIFSTDYILRLDAQFSKLLYYKLFICPSEHHLTSNSRN